MSKRSILMTASILVLAASAAIAKDFWESKAWTSWSEKEVKRILDNSPWGKTHTLTIMNPTETGTRDFRSIGGGDLEREKQNNFHIRFLTAKPIRMAIARQIMLGSKNTADKARLEKFVTQGDDENIILTISLSSNREGISSLRGYWSTLYKLSTPDLTTNTSLTTKTGKRVYLTRYEPPAQDGLGAKYYFPRKLEDGTPLVGPEDGEVRFETIINLVETGTFSGNPTADENTRSDRVWMQFDVRKMVFEGKVEL